MTDVRTRRPAQPSMWLIGRFRIGIELKQFFRDRESAVFTFSLPVLLLVIFGSVWSGQELGDTGISFSQYFVAGMIASGVVYTAFQNLAIAIPQEREDGTLKRLRGLPMPSGAYFIGKIGLVVVAYTAQVTLLIGVGVLFFEVELPSDATDWWNFTWLSVLGLVGCTLLGIAFSSVPRTGKGASAVVTPIVLVLQFISGVFFAFPELPHWMQTLASFFPLKWLTQGMRSVFLPDSAQVMEPADAWELPMVAAMLTLWCLIGLALALTTFRWQRRGEV